MNIYKMVGIKNINQKVVKAGLALSNEIDPFINIIY